ncbi:hypothetical protein [Meiothermus sp. PNK-Is4]|nr:hypothetical protein [Meiothermus sp. PNK-Is4]
MTLADPGAGAPEEKADIYAFLFRVLGLEGAVSSPACGNVKMWT